MKGWIRLTKRLIMCFLLMIGIIIVFPSKVIKSETNNQSELDMLISPQKNLYNITNLKPGDWAPRVIEVKNNGTLPFNYEMSLKNNGNDMLFNELLLEISLENNELYKGKLGDFTDLPLRELMPFTQEELDVTIRFPEESGNEFQGLDADFSFIFAAKAKNEQTEEVFINGVVGSGGSKLPSTATTIFTLLLVGGLLTATGWSIITYKKIRKKFMQA